MPHEPNGFQRHAQGAVHLVTADAGLAGTHQIDGLQPEVHCNVAVFKDGADLDGKRLAASVALVRTDAGGFAARLAAFTHNAALLANPVPAQMRAFAYA